MQLQALLYNISIVVKVMAKPYPNNVYIYTLVNMKTITLTLRPLLTMNTMS